MTSETDPTAGFAAEQIVTVFRSRPAAGARDEYESTADDMLARAREMPGFVDFKTFHVPDGEQVSIITFASEETQRAWRDQADHRRAQAAGRDRFYSSYSIQVSRCAYVRTFTRADATPDRDPASP